MDKPTTSKVEEKRKFYVTTAINYTNGPPHFGHAYEVVAADVIARYHRVCGEEVYFLTGTDEHGQKVADTAAAQGVKPIELCDRYVALFQALNKRLTISNDNFIRTTQPHHIEKSQWIWKKAAADIYLSDYVGWYSVREEKFLTENEASACEYKDPGTGKPLIKRSEPSYFFKMSKYQEKLIQHIHENSDFIQPEERRKEILSRLEGEPLLDLSISRATFDWGVPVPDVPGIPKTEQKHVMYVWFDALTNYLSAVDYPTGDLAKFWPASAHIIGKDIVWFHTVIWPCMLMSAEIPLPKTVVCHGFVNGPDGRKMSKSYGNVVDPNDILDKYSSDNLRFFMLSEGVFGSDFNFSEQALIRSNDFELAAALGNLVHRALSFSKETDRKVPSEPCEEIFSVAELKQKIQAELDHFHLQNALFHAFTAVKLTNKFLTSEAPWNLKGPDVGPKRASILRTALEALYICGHFCAPFIPTSMELLFKALNTPMTTLDKLNGWGNLKPGTPIDQTKDVLFKRIQPTRNDQKESGQKVTTVKAKGPVPNDVSRFNLVVGKILACKKHPDAEHLYVEEIDIGEKKIQVVSGLAKYIPLDQMTGRLVVVVKNMKVASLRGVQSEGMVIAASSETKVELVTPPDGARPGERIKFEGYPEDRKSVV